MTVREQLEAKYKKPGTPTVRQQLEAKYGKPQSDPQPAPQEAEPKGGLISDLKQRGIQAITGVKKSIDQAKDTYGISLGETPLRVAGAVGGAIGDIVGSGLGKILPAVKTVASFSPPALLYKSSPEPVKEALRDVAGTAGRGLSAILGKAGEKYDTFKANNPEIAQSLEDTANMANIPLFGKPSVKAGAKVLEKTAGGLADISEKNIIKSAAENSARAEKTTNTIIQGKKTDIPKAREVLKTISTKGIKTYADLSNALDDKAKALLSKVDELVASDKTLRTADELVLSKKVGEAEVRANFVQKALDHLEELYTKTDDIVNSERIRQLKGKVLSQGLNGTEINKIARDYGREFGEKAFNKLGEPLTSVNAQSFENVRKGVKETLRKFHPETQIFDEGAGRVIKVRDLISRVEEKVNALNAKIKNEPKIFKLGRIIGKTTGRIIDATFAGAPRAFLTSFLPSNIGNKIMNYGDIEKILEKNLKILEKLNNAKPSDLPAKLRNIENILKKLTK